MWSSERAFYILDENIFSDTWFPYAFSHSVALFFILLSGLLHIENVFWFWWGPMSQYLLLWIVLSVSSPQMLHQSFYAKESPLFLLKVVHCHDSQDARGVNVWIRCEVQVKVTFLPMYVHWLQHHGFNMKSFLQWLAFRPLSKVSWADWFLSISEFFIQSHWSVCCLHQ